MPIGVVNILNTLALAGSFPASVYTMAESARRQFDAVFTTALKSGALYALAFDK